MKISTGYEHFNLVNNRRKEKTPKKVDATRNSCGKVLNMARLEQPNPTTLFTREGAAHPDIFNGFGSYCSIL